MNKAIFFIFYLSLLIACSTKVQPAAIDYFEQASTLKIETQTIQDSTKIVLQDLRQTRNNIMVQGQILTESEVVFIDKVNEIIEEQGKLQKYLEDIEKSENAYEPNGKELLYLNQQANQLAKNIHKKIKELTAKALE